MQEVQHNIVDWLIVFSLLLVGCAILCALANTFDLERFLWPPRDEDEKP